MDDPLVTECKRRLKINAKTLALICVDLAHKLNPDRMLQPDEGRHWLKVFTALDLDDQQDLVDQHRERMRVKREQNRAKYFNMPSWILRR